MGKLLSLSCFLSTPFLSPAIPISLEDKSEGDRLHQWGHQDHPGNKEQNHLQAEWRDRKGSEKDCLVAQRWPAVYLWWDEWYKCSLFSDGTEAGGRAGDHLSEAVAKGPEGIQEILTQHPQVAVLVTSGLAAFSPYSPPQSLTPSSFPQPQSTAGLREGGPFF